MFTVGIFTTHIPYLAFLLFYAYFLLFGVNEASNGNIRVSENSQEVEFNLNAQHTVYLSDLVYHFDNQYEKTEETELPQLFQKFHWKSWFKHTLYKQDPGQGHFFCRPPPVAA